MAGVQHALVAAHDDVGMRGVAVAHGQEHGHQRAVGGTHRHVALVALHGGHQHARGQAQVLGSDGTGDDAGPLHQVHHLLDLARGVAPCPAGGRRGGVEARGDGGAALAVIGDDGGLTQLVAVRARARHLHRATEEAVPLAGAAGRDAGHLEHAGGVARLRRDPANGAREAQAPAIAPPHGLAEPEALQHAAGQFGHEVGQRGLVALLVDPHEVAAALGIGPRDQGRHVNPLAAGEALGGLGGRAVVPVGGLQGGPAHRAGLTGLAIGHARREHGDAAGGNPRHGGIGGKVQRLQGVGQQARGLGDGLAARAGRQLLAADLDEQIRHRRAPRCAPAMPRRSGPPARARARCRHRARSRSRRPGRPAG